MKKTIALVQAFVCLVSLAGCVASQSSKTDNKILNAWAGEFSEENLKDAINMYEKKYTSVLIDDAGEGSSVSFEVDFDVTYCCVTRLSYVSKDDISAELNGYIDLYPETEYSGNQVTIYTDWWNEDDWTKKYPVWSYLVLLKDTNNNEHYYYFRTDYSALSGA